MKPKRFYPHKDKKYRRVAAAFAGAALMSAALFTPLASAAKPPVEPVAAKPAKQNGLAKQVKVGKKAEQDLKAVQAVNRSDKTPGQAKQTKAVENSQAWSDAKQTLNATATAYAPGPHDNEQWGNKTYLGTQIRPGVIAVDPDVIPLGSKVYIELPNGDSMYAVAEDTGGAIKGNRIDIAKWSVAEAEDFGMKDVKVHILSRGTAK
ncbi:3D domain-containing protein|uniref:3D (Asp-Asp-Asp) domain-containing protein n=1 Tax=Dendrosporobacter quercicolus TaxID=146817 RepID=A0A1G9Q3Y4_9FIRM|nr:3D domain-containing protein [Dendrosporobacter quercicolus]NSL48110.1 3D domain-containing protein [Dendrosporobacter quercicolus DSM 1736]SDM05699.1 3D (Asp-Asp-Asp) domain-containing protein [Dendrosporobacter quercicolus]